MHITTPTLEGCQTPFGVTAPWASHRVLTCPIRRSTTRDFKAIARWHMNLGKWHSFIGMISELGPLQPALLPSFMPAFTSLHDNTAPLPKQLLALRACSRSPQTRRHVLRSTRSTDSTNAARLSPPPGWLITRQPWRRRVCLCIHCC